MKQYILKLKSENQYNQNISSLLQGVLMENLEPEYAETLHQTGSHPYSQYITTDKNTVIWTVNCLSEEFENRVKPFLFHAEKIRLKYKDDVLDVVEKSIRTVTVEEIVSKYGFKDSSRYIQVEFISPTSFKQNGSYAIFPDCRLIFQSLLMKFNAASGNQEFFTDEVLPDFEENCSIVDYRLRTVKFHLEGVKIPSFIGRITIRVNGNQQLVNMANMLIDFGAFSGVGIKTGIGMGAIRRAA